MNYSVNEFLLHLSLALSVVICLTFIFLLFFALFILKKKRSKKIPKTFKVKVNYNQSFEEMLKPLGECLIGEDINSKNFPINKTGIWEVELKIFTYGKDVHSLYALNKMKNEGFTISNLFEMLALIKENPKELEDITLIALGSFWINGKNQFLKPYFYSDDKGKELDLDEDDGEEWPEYCSFLGVKYK